MAAPTPLSPLPFVGFTVSIPDGVTNVEADPSPFSNTKEIVVLNTSETETVYFRLADLLVIQAKVVVWLLTGSAALGDDIDPWGGGPLVGAAARVSGADNFDATLTDSALQDDIVAALNDAANSWSADLTAANGPSRVIDGELRYSVEITVDAAFAVGAASNGIGITVTNVGTQNFGLSPSGTATGSVTAGGKGEDLASLTIDSTNSVCLPPQTGITLCIGPEGERNDLAGDDGSSGLALVFSATAGPTDVAVTYVQCRGGGGGGGC